MHFKRWFLIEPNLKKSYGHVVEFPFALQNYLRAVGKEVYVICNKQIENNLLNHLDNTYPFISHGCFENLEDRGKSFSEDLSELNKKFKFTDNDLIISLTSYSNQIYGIAKFIKDYAPKNGLTFCMWFHQLYPPTKDFNRTLNAKFRQKVEMDLEKAFKSIKGLERVFTFATVSENLKKVYSDISSRPVGTLPLPYSSLSKPNKKQPKRGHFIFGSLGDGRYEKGLLIVLNYILTYKDRDNLFILQNLFPRGYTKEGLNNLKKLEAEMIKDYSNVSLVKDPLSSSQYQALISKIDAFLLPYHPQSYDKRISGVFIEAVINSKPVIASDKTWMAEQVKLLDNEVTFDYHAGAGELRSAILKLTGKYKYFSNNAIKASSLYREIHSPSNFVKSLLDFIN